MYAIENELGRFEADSEKEAKKLLRRAQAQEREKQKKYNAYYEIARLRAESIGFKLLIKCGGLEMPRGWYFHTPDEKYSPFNYRLCTDTFSHKPRITWHTEQGNIETTHYGMRFIGAVSNGAGFPICAFFCEDSRPDSLECLALGFQGEAVAFIPVPGITPELFNSRKKESA